MSSRAHKLIEEFFALAQDEQAEVLEAIVPTEELEPEFRAELERRVRSLRDGTAVLHDWDDVARELDEIVARALAATQSSAPALRFEGSDIGLCFGHVCASRSRAKRPPGPGLSHGSPRGNCARSGG
jgi:hypothetical protein